MLGVTNKTIRRLPPQSFFWFWVVPYGLAGFGRFSFRCVCFAPASFGFPSVVCIATLLYRLLFLLPHQHGLCTICGETIPL